MAQDLLTNDFDADVLDEITSAMNALDGAFLGLLAGPFSATKKTTYADVTDPSVLPTYNTYAEIAVAAWSPAFLDLDGVVKTDGGDTLFGMVNGLVTNQIWGWYLANAAKTRVYRVVTFDTPVYLNAPPDGVLVDLVQPLCIPRAA